MERVHLPARSGRGHGTAFAALPGRAGSGKTGKSRHLTRGLLPSLATLDGLHQVLDAPAVGCDASARSIRPGFPEEKESFRWLENLDHPAGPPERCVHIGPGERHLCLLRRRRAEDPLSGAYLRGSPGHRRRADHRQSHGDTRRQSHASAPTQNQGRQAFRGAGGNPLPPRAGASASKSVIPAWNSRSFTPGKLANPRAAKRWTGSS